MNVNKHKILGKQAYHTGIHAEEIAINYFQNKGWTILERRFKCSFGEIDLIAYNQNDLIFIEVKARKKMTDALHALTHKQQERIINSATYYLSLPHDKIFDNLRFDLVTVNQYHQIQHLENVIIL